MFVIQRATSSRWSLADGSGFIHILCLSELIHFGEKTGPTMLCASAYRSKHVSSHLLQTPLFFGLDYAIKFCNVIWALLWNQLIKLHYRCCFAQWFVYKRVLCDASSCSCGSFQLHRCGVTWLSGSADRDRLLVCVWSRVSRWKQLDTSITEI